MPRMILPKADLSGKNMHQLLSAQRMELSAAPKGVRDIIRQALTVLARWDTDRDADHMMSGMLPLYNEYKAAVKQLEPRKNFMEVYVPLQAVFSECALIGGLGAMATVDTGGFASWIAEALMFSGRCVEALDFLCAEMDKWHAVYRNAHFHACNFLPLMTSFPTPRTRMNWLLRMSGISTSGLTSWGMGHLRQIEAIVDKALCDFERQVGTSALGYFFTRWLRKDTGMFKMYNIPAAEHTEEKAPERMTRAFNGWLGRDIKYLCFVDSGFDHVFAKIMNELFRSAENAVRRRHGERSVKNNPECVGSRLLHGDSFEPADVDFILRHVSNRAHHDASNAGFDMSPKSHVIMRHVRNGNIDMIRRLIERGWIETPGQMRTLIEHVRKSDAPPSMVAGLFRILQGMPDAFGDAFADLDLDAPPVH